MNIQIWEGFIVKGGFGGHQLIYQNFNFYCEVSRRFSGLSEDFAVSFQLELPTDKFGDPSPTIF